MIEIKGQPGELRFTVEIKRKDTGAVETYEMVGHADPEKLKQLLGAADGSNPLNTSPGHSD